MHTTAEDYITFLQYCFKNNYLKSTLLTGALSTLPQTTSPETTQVRWGLGMGVYSDKNSEKNIAFHWGNNKGSISFCALDMKAGDSVASFANSMNGPSVFQQLAKPIVGDMKPLFQWLSTYCDFKDVNPTKAPETIAKTIYSLARKKQANKGNEVTNQFKHGVKAVRASHMTPTISSKAKERERFNSSPLETIQKPSWKP